MILKYRIFIIFYFISLLIFSQKKLQINDSVIFTGKLNTDSSYFFEKEDFVSGNALKTEKIEKVYIYGFDESLPLLQGYINNKEAFFLPSSIKWENNIEKEYLTSKKGDKLIRKKVLETYLQNSQDTSEDNENEPNDSTETLDSLKYYFLHLHLKKRIY